jgi:hypothetical protein
MQLCLGKITKQSQTTDCPSSLDAMALVMAMEPAGSTPDVRCLRMILDSE